MMSLSACGDRTEERNDGIVVNGYASAPAMNSCFNRSQTYGRNGWGSNVREWNWVTDRNHGDQNPYNDRPYSNSRRGYQPNNRSSNYRTPSYGVPNYNIPNYSTRGFCGCPQGTIPTCDASGMICVSIQAFPNQQVAYWGYNQQQFAWGGYINPYTQERTMARNSCWSGVAQTCQPGAIQGATFCQQVPNSPYGVWVQR